MKRNFALTSILVLALVFLASSQAANAFSLGAGADNRVEVGHGNLNADSNSNTNIKTESEDQDNNGSQNGDENEDHMLPNPILSHFFGSSTKVWNGLSGVIGTVTAVNGNTITVNGFSGFDQNASTTFTVDASNATVVKNGTSSSVSSIAVNDRIIVKGTVNGNSVTASAIYDGMFAVNPGKKHPTPEPIIQGNGEPVIGGTVSAVSGNTITITTSSGNLTYNVDATNAVVEKNKATSSVSSINVGDKVLVQGTFSGNSVTASSVIDSNASASVKVGQGLGHIWKSIGGFFHRLFGFF